MSKRAKSSPALFSELLFDRRLGAKLRELRMRAGITQMQLAALLGVSFQQVQKYESGTNRISVYKLKQAAQAFKIPAESLLMLEASDALPPAPGGQESMVTRLFQHFHAISQQKHRKLLCDVAEALAGES